VFIALCLVLLIGGLTAGTLLLFATIEPLPLLPQVGVQEIAEGAAVRQNSA
jgi:hypothetical protein